MKTIQFILPVANERSVVVQEDILPYAYNELHHHRETQITLIIKGAGTFILGDTVHSFESGDIYIVGADRPHVFKSEPHYFVHVNPDQTHAIHIYFDYRKTLNALLDLPEFQAMAKFLDHAQNGLRVPTGYALEVSGKIALIKDTSGFERMMYLLQLLQFFAINVTGWETLSEGPSTISVAEPERFRINEVYQYTLAHFSENISLKQVAAIACLTTYAFCKYFKKHTRKTYIAFLNEIRIKEACKIILSREYESIASVAYATGFNNPITFNRVFKKVTGKRPTDLIQEMKSGY